MTELGTITVSPSFVMMVVAQPHVGHNARFRADFDVVARAHDAHVSVI